MAVAAEEFAAEFFCVSAGSPLPTAAERKCSEDGEPAGEGRT